MSDKLKKSILIITIVLINIVLIVFTGSSVFKAIKDVFETGGVSSTTDENVDGTNTDGEMIAENNNENSSENNIIADKEQTNNVDDSIINNNEKVEDTEPIVEVQSKLLNGNTTFVIDAEDDESIKTVSIIHNGGEEQTIDVNEREYHKNIIMTEGETNTLIVTATNINGLTKTRKIKFDNK